MSQYLNKNKVFRHIHHVDTAFLKQFRATYAPVFILNTGRSGSKMLQAAFNTFPDFAAQHEASPNLMAWSNFAYHHQTDTELLRTMFLVAREELMLSAAVANNTYLETNQCLVFYTRQVATLFPQARFVHLLRHPRDFVQSAIKKGWHRNDSLWESGRIRLNDQVTWDQMEQPERLAWVWQATHQFIDREKTALGDRIITLKLEDLIEDHHVFIDLLEHIGSDAAITRSAHKALFAQPQNKVRLESSDPPNMYKTDQVPDYKLWQESLLKWTSGLAMQYGYDL